MNGRFAPKPKKLCFSFAFTSSEISRRIAGRRDAGMTDGDVDRTGAVFGKRLADQLRFDDLGQRNKGHVDRHADRERPGVGGTMVMDRRERAIGLVGVSVMRVSASMPSVSVTADASTRGCAAIARIGRSSSQSGGIVPVAPVPCSGIERQALAHCSFALCSKAGSLRIRACTAASWSATVLSSSGLTCAAR